jgi:hypothetical protein
MPATHSRKSSNAIFPNGVSITIKASVYRIAYLASVASVASVISMLAFLANGV